MSGGTRWRPVTPYADARCLVGRNQLGESVAAVTVWSAGEGKPGLLEPMGVHRAAPRPRLRPGDHRRGGREHCGSWARRARSSARLASTSARSRPTSRPASSNCRRPGTCTATPRRPRRRRPGARGGCCRRQASPARRRSSRGRRAPRTGPGTTPRRPARSGTPGTRRSRRRSRCGRRRRSRGRARRAPTTSSRVTSGFGTSYESASLAWSAGFIGFRSGSRLLGARDPVDVLAGRRTYGTKVTMQTPSLRGERLEYVVGHVPRYVADRAGRRVAEDHRRAGHPQRVPHGVGGDVREVDQHADPVHLPDDLLAELVQPAEHRLVGRGVRPGHVVVVRERHVPNTQLAHDPQHPERLTDRVPALHPHQRGDPAGLERRVDVVGRRCASCKPRREPLDQPAVRSRAARTYAVPSARPAAPTATRTARRRARSATGADRCSASGTDPLRSWASRSYPHSS